MNRDDHLNNIAKNFGRLTHEIRALNATGRFDINSVAEDFLIPVLKVAFACPHLRNQNEIKMNFPAVDLGCKTTRISFQITTDASSGKAEKTLKKFSEHGLDNLFAQVYILALTEKQSTYKASALATAIANLTIPFDPAEHIIDIKDLLSKIRHLDTSDLERIDAYMASGWSERDRFFSFRDQLDKFLEFSTNKILLEKRTRKYIPSIFVETHSAKEEVRSFANPLFFYRKIQDILFRVNYDHLNSRIRIAGEPELVLDLDHALLTEEPSTFAELGAWLNSVAEAIARELVKVRPMSWKPAEGEARYAPVNGDTVNWQIARWQIEVSATGLTNRFQDALDLISLIQNKIFLVTSMAGQGKTNFVCDLVENQFRSFAIPCLFIPARELNNYPSGKRVLDYILNNRYSPDVNNIHECLELFNNIALEGNKPFLVVIDGINEVADLNAFSDELKAILNAICQYDLVKVIITCRSEFFDEKFASMLDEPYAVHIHRISDLRSKMTEQSKDRLLNSYFIHFDVKGSFSRIAKDFLKGDFLLLRIFCERYERSDVGYMADIYKGDLFEQYLHKKITSFPRHLQANALPTLYRIVTAMLDADDFAKLSVRSFTSEEQEVVRRFIEEDIILRQEIGTQDLSALGDLAISFTYDELRDFVIAYKLIVGEVNGNAESLRAVLVTLPGRPIYEGVYRYAYLLARKANNVAAIAVCESSPDFIEHFSLNFHLLPPAVQTREDVERVKALLDDSSAPERLRRAVRFLLLRQDPSELLNITILLDHLNELETTDHEKFVQAIFSNRHDYRGNEWKQRLHQLIFQVLEGNTEETQVRYDPKWLAFFLHISSLADWSEWEMVSTMFYEALGASNCRKALEFVRPARSELIRYLLAEIESREDGGQ